MVCLLWIVLQFSFWEEAWCIFETAVCCCYQAFPSTPSCLIELTQYSLRIAVWSSYCLLVSVWNSPWKLLCLLKRKTFYWLLATAEWMHTSLNALQTELPQPCDFCHFPPCCICRKENGERARVPHLPSCQVKVWVHIMGLDCLHWPVAAAAGSCSISPVIPFCLSIS